MSLADGKANLDMDKSVEEVAAEQDKVSKVKVETKIEVGTSSRWPPNRTNQLLQLRDRRGLRGLPCPR
jgi:hypothetical protein